MASILNQDFPDDEEDDFNPAPEIGSDDEADEKPQVDADADDDDALPRSVRNRSPPKDEDEDALKDEEPGTVGAARRVGADEDGEQRDNDEEEDEDNEEDEDEDEEDEDDDIVRTTLCVDSQCPANHACREHRRANAERKAGGTSSSMSRPKLMKRMRRSLRRMRTCPVKRCIPTTCKSYRQAPTETIGSIGSSTVNESRNFRSTWRRRPHG